MKKQLIILIAALAVLAALGGLLFFALRGGGPSDASSSEESSIPLLSSGETAEPLLSITLKNEKGTYTLTKSGEQFDAKELEGLPVDSGRVQELVNQAQTLSATRALDFSGNPADYGLELPRATMTLKTASGEKTLSLGSDAPSSLGTYLQMADKLYLVPSEDVSAFFYGVGDLLSLQVVPPLEEGETISEITLTQKDESPVRLTYVPEKQVEASSVGSASGGSSESGPSGSSSEPAMETVPAAYRMTAPFNMELRESLVSAWADPVFGLTAQSVEAIRPTEQALEDLGLSAPAFVLEIRTSSGETVKLSAAAPAGGSCFVMREGVPLIYRIPAESLGWLAVTPEVLAGTLFPGVEPAQIRTLTITGEGRSNVFENNNGAAAGNGTPITKEAFDTLVKDTLHLAITPLEGEAVLRFDPAITLEITYQDESRPADVLEFISDGEGKLYLSLNGQVRYTAEEWEARSLLDACQTALTPPESESASSSAPAAG